MATDLDAPRYLEWSASCCVILLGTESDLLEDSALGTLAHVKGTSENGIKFQRGSFSSVSLEVFTDAGCASKVTDRR